MLGTLLPAATLPVELCAQDSGSAAREASRFVRDVVPFLQQHCVTCHGGREPEGGLALDRYRETGNVQQDIEIWEKVRRMVNDRQMPPADEAQPSAEEIVALIGGIDAELATFDCSAAKRPGRVTIRRLNRPEYNNTIRDLVGLDLPLADDFPADDVGNGFDNMGDVLSIPPLLLEKYLSAAETIAERVLQDEQARRRVFVEETTEDDEKVAVARRNLRAFATRAFRRPVTEEELERLFGVLRHAWEQGSSESEILQAAITAVLASPQFLFRVELDPSPEDEDGIRELNDYELATRLSYFLWSSMPDAELFNLARQGELHQPDVLASQARRMLLDPKSRALVDNFAGQWLQLRDVARLTPDPEKFTSFDADLREAMRRETELLFETLLREDRSLVEFLDADFTFVNERLAEHYNIPDVTGDEFRRVSLPPGRRGVLTHASILLLTSNPTRTSPVKRGKWILDNMLGEPPPPPPPNVPVLEEGLETLGTLREQMEQHRTNESCAVCHRKMDALGFGLENFDAIGGWRDQEGRFPVDASGELPGGRKFTGPVELVRILVDEKKLEFCRCVASKMLTYALGRGLESYDRCTVNEIVDQLSENEFRFGTLMTAIVTSDAFTQREGRRDP